MMTALARPGVSFMELIPPFAVLAVGSRRPRRPNRASGAG
jgi:hypothetical protein